MIWKLDFWYRSGPIRNRLRNIRLLKIGPRYKYCIYHILKMSTIYHIMIHIWCSFLIKFHFKNFERSFEETKNCYFRILIVWVILTWSVCRSLYVDLCFDIYLEKSSSWKCRLKTIRLTRSYKKSHTKTFVLFNSPVHNIHEIKFWKKISIIKKLQTKPTFAWKFWICSNKK